MWILNKLHWTISANNTVIPLLLIHPSTYTHLQMMHPHTILAKQILVTIIAIHKVEEMSVKRKAASVLGLLIAICTSYWIV